MALQRDAEHQVHARIARVAQVVHAVYFDNINVLRVEPVARPRRLEPEPIAAVLEAVIAVIGFANAKAMFTSEVGLVTVRGNAAAACAFFLLFGLGLLGMLFLRIFLFRLVLKAAFSLLKRDGFDGVSTQQIARKAGVSTATLYRWWENKEAILLDAYLETTRDILPQGDGGSPLGRLRMYSIRVASFLKGPNGLVFQRLLMTIQDNPALRKAFYKKIFLPREAEGCAVVREAIEAGELPGSVDPNLLINLLTGPQIFSALLGQNLGRKSAERIFDFVLKATSHID